jgi:hypothetical protein
MKPRCSTIRTGDHGKLNRSSNDAKKYTYLEELSTCQKLRNAMKGGRFLFAAHVTLSETALLECKVELKRPDVENHVMVRTNFLFSSECISELLTAKLANTAPYISNAPLSVQSSLQVSEN